MSTHHTNNPSEPCGLCGHPFSAHYSDDARGLGSKDASQVHKGCSYAAETGAACTCPGFTHPRHRLGQ